MYVDLRLVNVYGVSDVLTDRALNGYYNPMYVIICNKRKW